MRAPFPVPMVTGPEMSGRLIARCLFAFLGVGNNTTADNNTAIGDAAMQVNTTGFYNVAAGSGAMNFNTSGSLNTALGAKALGFNGTGGKNTAVGYGALNLLVYRRG
ncbi:MAG: hypothetical protein ABIO87_09885 [Chthoniobacterales bacterium]